MKLLETGSLVAATITAGLMAGLFTSFAYAIMPGLRAADDRTFVEAMRRINSAILNGWFLVSFLGALVFTGLAAVLHFSGGGQALRWIIAGLVLYVTVLVITGTVNVPLNNELDAAARSSIADFAAIRHRFETKWVTWNLARAAAATGSFGSLTVALVLHGRAVA